MVTVFDALYSLNPKAEFGVKNNTYAGIEWFSTSITKPTEQEVNAEITRLTEQSPLSVCKAEAKKRIAATDWSVLPDVSISNRAEFESYRATLRALIITPVANPSYPVEPQPVWL